MTELDDRTLLDRWQAGDTVAGQALFAKHFQSVYSFFSTKLSDEAEELTQKTFAACVQARVRFRGDSTFKTFLFAIAKHQLYAAIETVRRTGARLDYGVTSIQDLVTTPGTKLARDQEHRHVIEAMRRLPIEQQALLEMHYWEELDAAALAEIFETTDVTIRQRLSRARKALRELLESTHSPAIADKLFQSQGWLRE